MNTLHSQKTTQVNLEDPSGLTYRVEILPAKLAPLQVQACNIDLKAVQSPLRWKIDGEEPEFDLERSFDEMLPLIEILAFECKNRGLPLFINIPYKHSFGGQWDAFTCSQQEINKTPTWFSRLSSYMQGMDREANVEINNQEKGGENKN